MEKQEKIDWIKANLENATETDLNQFLEDLGYDSDEEDEEEEDDEHAAETNPNQ